MMASYALALCLHKPEQFGVLVGASLSAIVGSALFFTRHVLHQAAAAACNSPPAVQLRATAATRKTGYTRLDTEQQQQRTPTNVSSMRVDAHSPLKHFQFNSPQRWGKSHSADLQQQQQYTAL
jgi:hypothetical protein